MAEWRRGLRYRWLKAFGVVDYVPKLPPWHQEHPETSKQASERLTDASPWEEWGADSPVAEFTAREIAQMSVEEYAKHRSLLLRQARAYMARPKHG